LQSFFFYIIYCINLVRKSEKQLIEKEYDKFEKIQKFKERQKLLQQYEKKKKDEARFKSSNEGIRSLQ